MILAGGIRRKCRRPFRLGVRRLEVSLGEHRQGQVRFHGGVFIGSDRVCQVGTLPAASLRSAK